MNGKNLQVRPDGSCVFANCNELLWEQFDIEVAKNKDSFYFISCHNNKVLNCNLDNAVWCVINNSDRGRWDRWQVVIPDANVVQPMRRMIPLNTPICLKAHTGNNLQNEFFWRAGRCSNRNTQAWEQMIIKKLANGKFIIKSRWDERNLQVRPDGRCIFDNHNELLWEQFEIEALGDGRFIFISCHTGKLLQCDASGLSWCANSYKDRGDWEAWTIIFPDDTNMMTAKQLQDRLLIGVAVVAGAVIAVGVISWVCVPWAMSTFGVVVAGVGTMHASLAAGGVAATLQATSAALLSPHVLVPCVIVAATSLTASASVKTAMH